MVWLPEGEKIVKIYLFVLTQSTNVTSRRSHRHRMTAKATLDVALRGKNAYEVDWTLDLSSITEL